MNLEYGPMGDHWSFSIWNNTLRGNRIEGGKITDVMIHNGWKEIGISSDYVIKYTLYGEKNVHDS